MAKTEYRFRAFQTGKANRLVWNIRYPDLPEVEACGSTIEEAIAAGQESIRRYLRECKNLGQKVPEPSKEPVRNYSGRLVLRFASGTHERIALLAQEENVSINYILNQFIERGLAETNERKKK